MFPVQLRLIVALAGVLSLTASYRRGPEISYSVSVDPGDSSSVRVWMQIGRAPRSMRVAMAVHPEYDDRFWRYITDWHVDGVDRLALLTVDRENVWRVITHAGYANLSYRVQLPHENPTNRPVWHTFIRSDGGSINPVDTFLYLADFPHAKVRLQLGIGVPVVWDVPERHLIAIADGYPSQDFETDVATLLDTPLLYGSTLRFWSFSVDGVPHTVVYWPLPNPHALRHDAIRRRHQESCYRNSGGFRETVLHALQFSAGRRSIWRSRARKFCHHRDAQSRSGVQSTRLPDRARSRILPRLESRTTIPGGPGKTE
jgi:predicted metalloprotease with PDZ domain